MTLFAGTRVLDLTQGMAGPLATMVLADHGADVVKVEPPGGDWARGGPGFPTWNRGKRSIVLDLDEEAARERLRALARGADVLVTASRPGSLERRGLEDVRAAHPGLVSCDITGFGPYEGLADVRAYEGSVAAATGRFIGLDRLSGGHPGWTYDRPAFTAAPVASYGAAQLAVQAITAALIERRRTGLGQQVETSLLEGAIAFVMRQELGRAVGGAPADVIAPATHRGIELCFITAECADGRYIQMCARQDRHFRDWLRVLDLGHLLEDPRYERAPMGLSSVEAGDELEVRLRERMRTRTQAEWMQVFTEEVDVGADPFLSPEEFLRHPDMVANGRVVEIEDPEVGPTRQLGPLVAMSETPAVIERPAPRLGEHSREVSWRPLPTTGGTGRAASVEERPPLEGITILEVAYYIAGPLATTVLAEMGARVIKVEPLEGDPYRRTGLQSAKFVHGKESITLDLKSDDGQRVLRELIARSDALVHSFRASATQRLGLDYASVHAVNPRLVYLYAGSYGSSGPQAHRAAFHSTPNALTGGGVKQAGAGNPPVNDSYADPGAALGAATALVLGLYAQAKTGRGQYLETTMLCSTGYLHSGDTIVYEGQPDWLISDSGQHGLHALYRLYRAADGWIFLAAPQDEEWRRVAQVLGFEDLRDDPTLATRTGRRARSEELAERIGVALSAAPVSSWVDRFHDADVSAVAVHEGPFDAWLKDSGLLVPEDHPMYPPYWRLPPKARFSRSRPRLGPAAGPGEHSRPLLEELNYTSAEIDRLVEQRVTSEPAPVAAS